MHTNNKPCIHCPSATPTHPTTAAAVVPAGVSSGQGACAEMTPGRRGATAGSAPTGVSPVVNRSSSTPPLSTFSQQ